MSGKSKTPQKVQAKRKAAKKAMPVKSKPSTAAVKNTKSPAKKQAAKSARPTAKKSAPVKKQAAKAAPKKSSAPVKKQVSKVAAKKSASKSARPTGGKTAAKKPAAKTSRSTGGKSSPVKKMIPSVKGKANGAATKNVKPLSKAGASKSPAKKAPAKKAAPSGSKTQTSSSQKSKSGAGSSGGRNQQKSTLPEVKPGEDMHFIPKAGEEHPITTIEAHGAENKFQQREQLAINQENKKMQQANPVSKNMKRFNRNRGRS